MTGSGRKKKKESNRHSQDRWLVTYADLITLLMIFFVMMYTMSQVDARKYAAVANSLSIVLTGQAMSVLETQGPSLAEGISGQQLPEGLGEATAHQGQLQEVRKLIQEFIETQDIETGVGETGGKATKLSEYIIVYEQERTGNALRSLFSSGSDERPQARNVIRQEERLCYTAKLYSVGHTDNHHNTTRFPELELSTRASNVGCHEEAGVPADRLSIIGYGEYRPLVPNEDSGSRAMNRRVDIVILKQKYDYFEPPSSESFGESSSVS